MRALLIAALTLAGLAALALPMRAKLGGERDWETRHAEVAQLTADIEHGLDYTLLLALEVSTGRALTYDALNDSMAQVQLDAAALNATLRAEPDGPWRTSAALLEQLDGLERGVAELREELYAFASENSLMRHELRLLSHKLVSGEVVPAEFLRAGALLASNLTLAEQGLDATLAASLAAASDDPALASHFATLRALEGHAAEVATMLDHIEALRRELPVAAIATANTQRFAARTRAERTTRDRLQLVAILLGGLVALGVVRVVRSNRRAQRAEDESAARADFLANMSHEVRTPMNGIVTVSALLCEEELPEKSREYAGIIHSSAGALMRILNDILDFSKIDAGKIELETAAFCPRELVEGVGQVMSTTAAEKGLELVVEAAPDLPGQLDGDAGRLRQILLNLLGNAVKFTAAGRVALRIDALEVGPGTFALTIAVEDSGIGISAAQLETLFEPFKQADASTTRRYGGTGLGLTICRRLAELMGGSLDVTSVPGEGSTFALSLELRGRVEALPPHAPEALATSASETAAYARPTAAEARAEPASTTLAAPAEDPAAPRILLVEDNRVNQKVAEITFRRLGHKLTIADNGQLGVEAVQGELPDIVFMDCQMPVMDGYTAAQTIRALGGAAGELPIIALTANALKGDRERCLEAGMTDFMTKPIELDVLEAMLARYLPGDPNESAAA